MSKDEPETREFDRSRDIAARAAGFLYLFTNATAIVGFYARGQVYARGDAVQTARNLATSERLFRVGIVSELITVAGVVMLVVALYAILEPINRNVALLAAFWRLLENVVLAIIPLNAFVALSLLSGADYLRAVDAHDLQALAHMFLRLHLVGFRIGFLFLGLGSAAFAWLWLKSRYIPRALAVLGIVASLVMAIAESAIIAFPGLAAVVGLAYMAPMGVFEFTLGGWLLVKGLRTPTSRDGGMQK
jgi:hypothetical protein